MGAKSWMIAYADGRPRDVLTTKPPLDPAATDGLVTDLFGAKNATRVGETDLYAINPPDREIVAGAFPGLFVVAAREFGLDRPSELKSRFLERAPARDLYLYAQHSVVDWSAFAVWEAGELRRSMSAAPDFGIQEDLGERFDFEEPFWSGDHPAVEDEEEDEYPLPFHPLEFGETVLVQLFGFALEGAWLDDSVDPEEIRLLRYQRAPWWKVW